MDMCVCVCVCVFAPHIPHWPNEVWSPSPKEELVDSGTFQDLELDHLFSFPWTW